MFADDGTTFLNVPFTLPFAVSITLSIPVRAWREIAVDAGGRAGCRVDYRIGGWTVGLLGELLDWRAMNGRRADWRALDWWYRAGVTGLAGVGN
jgi:hypothetical protein